eukprot:TRINITY_DN5223_c0_g1_i3.p1 TRINITY_DN5223_c0_g1~~TRINITY_DN5223_c0_g1_i3.p1  ORF type:complete len:1291 (+),score=217.93 TRINITY_DN5223_c0_g1_i3:486-3875(+)
MHLADIIGQAPRYTPLREISELQASFRIMCHALKEYRSFLPPAVLAYTERQRKERGSIIGLVPHGEEAGARTVRLPQLSQPKMRSALQCIISQATGKRRAEVNNLFTQQCKKSIANGDSTTAWNLIKCGWDAPRDLRGKLPPEQPHDHGEVHILNAHRHSLDDPERRRSHLSSRLTDAEFQGNRFGDGADAAGSAIATVALFPPEYMPDPILESAANMELWHDPKGLTHWSSVAVEHVIADYHTCHPTEDVDKLALWIYTAEMSQQVLWACWQKPRWVRLPDLDLSVVVSQTSPSRRRAAPTFEHVLVPEDLAVSLGVEPDGAEASSIARSPSGLQVFEVGGQPRLVRYENVQHGDEELSPLHVPIAWVPDPDTLVSPDGIFSIARHAYVPPPPGVFEFIASRGFTTNIERHSWSSVPVELPALTRLRDICMAQKNQQRVDERICQKVDEAFAPGAAELSEFGAQAAQLAAAIPVIYGAKCPAAKPTPERISHATELNLLQWQESFFLLGFTGAPRSAAHLAPDEAPRAHIFRRIDCPYDDQPYYLMNSAIRHQQGHRFGAVLQTGASFGEHPDGKVFTARQPLQQPPEPAPVRFEAQAGGRVFAVWTGPAWKVTVASGRSFTVFDAVLNVNAWALPQYRSIIWHLDAVLRALPADDRQKGNQKGYRGLANVALDPSVYCRGSVVVFGAFTSTSVDQGVASGFAASDECAAIFTMYGYTGRFISFWSRYAREKEVLYPPNTLHLVTEALSTEHAAILDKRKLQLFDLKELSVANAVYHMAREGALDASKEYPSLLQQAERARGRAAEGDWAGAARELLTEPTGAAERLVVLPVLRYDTVGVVALLFSSPEGSEVGSGLDPDLWSSFFKHAEQVAEAHGARVIATHVGAVLLQAERSSLDMAARSAVIIAGKLLMTGDESLTSPDDSPRSAGAVALVSAAATYSAVMQRRRTLASRGDLQVHCGISAGAVSSGLAGGQQQVEIADGPAVRRARRMAAYSKFYGMTEAIADDVCAETAGRMYMSTWTTDLIFFSAESSVREYIVCIGHDTSFQSGGAAGSSAVSATDAAQIQAAWEAILQAGNDSADDAAARVHECIALLSAEAEAHRAVHALQEAATCPATYCCHFDPTL